MSRWQTEPYPYCVIDNFLSNDDFNRLKDELNTNPFHLVREK